MAAIRQPELFGERGVVEADRTPAEVAPQAGAWSAGLSDDELIAALPEATLSDVEGLCAAAVSRSLVASVPALERLWRRFAGFGIDAHLVEQRAVLGALAAIGDDGAIVHLGRCAERHPALAGAVVAALRDMESTRAERLAVRLEAQGRRSDVDGG